MNRDVDPIDFEEQEPRRTAGLTTRGGIDLLLLIRLALACVLFIIGLAAEDGGILKLSMMLGCFLIVSYDIVLSVITSLLQERVLDEKLLPLIASLAAFAVSLDYEGAAIMLLYRIFALLGDYVADRSRKTALRALNNCPSTVTVLTDEGECELSPYDVRPGDTVVLRPGDVAGVDCIVADGYTSIDSSSVTGTELLLSVEEGDSIPAGSVNVGSMIQGEAICGAADSTPERIREIVTDDDAELTRLERLIGKYRPILVPLILAMAAVYAVALAFVSHLEVADAVHRAIILLILLSPAPLLSGHALSYFTGICGAAKRGILFHGRGTMDAVAHTGTLAFDMSGTVTTGEYTVSKVISEHFESDVLLKAAAHAAANATSPEARAIVNAYGGAIDYSIISNLTEYPEGFSVTIEGIPVLMGTRAFLEQSGVAMEGEDGEDTLNLHIALGGRFAGTLFLSDTIRPAADEAVDRLCELGCEDIVLLSEENRTKTRETAHAVGISNYYYQCLPMDKLSRIRELNDHSAGASSVFVCSPDADTATLDAADISILMGGLDSGVSSDSVDVVCMDNDILKIPRALHYAQYTGHIAVSGDYLVLGVKALLLLLTIVGITGEAWFAVVLDGAAGVAGLLNAVRAYRPK